jgi:hypothetical protein
LSKSSDVSEREGEEMVKKTEKKKTVVNNKY